MNTNYLLVKVSVNCVIKKESKFLLVKQARPKYVRGKWSLSGGKVNEGESFEDAVNREIKEELGLKAGKIKLLDIIQETPLKTVKHIFAVEIKDRSNIKLKKEEILDAEWFSLKEINYLKSQNKLRGDWVVEAIQMVIN